MRKLLGLILLVTGVTAHAGLSEVEKSELKHRNILYNPGFESGVAGWTASGGTKAAVTSGSNLLLGNGSLTWDSSAAAQTLCSKSVAIPNGLKGDNGLVAVKILTPSGTATHVLSANDGTNDLATTTVVSSTSPVTSYVNFVFPSSGNIRLCLTSVAADEPLVSLDESFVGDAANITSVLPQDVFSAKVSSADAVSDENVDWINGNCTNATAGVATCTFNSGIFTATPNCQCTPTNEYDGEKCNVSTTSSSAVTLLTEGGTSFGANTNGGFILSCQKSGADAPVTAIKADTSGFFTEAEISGAVALGLSSDGSPVEATDASLTLVPISGRSDIEIPCSSTNPSTGYTCSAGNESVGIVINAPYAGDYEVCTQFTHQGRYDSTGDGLTVPFKIVETPNNAQTVLQDRPTVTSRRVFSVGAGFDIFDYRPIKICNVFSLSSSGKKTFRLFKQNTVASTPNVNSIQDGATWSVKAITQQLPAPLIKQSVVTSADAVWAIESAKVANDDTVSQESGDWINGNCTDATTGQATCNFNSGTFSSTPNCVCTTFSGASTTDQTCSINTVSSTQVVIRTTGNNALADKTLFLHCHGPR